MKYKVLDLVQGSEEWLAYRKAKIGGSDCPTIMGDGYKTAYQLWEEKRGLKEQYVSQAMRHGSASEGDARKWCAENLAKAEISSPVCESLERPWQIASLDGLFEANGDQVVLEIKCPMAHNFERICITPSLQRMYEWQIQHNLAVTGLNQALLLIWKNDKEYLARYIERDERVIEALIEKELQFYNQLMSMEPVAFEEPWEVREDGEWIELAERYRFWDGQEERAVAQKKQLKEQMLEMANGKKSKGGGVSLFFSERAGAVNYKSIPELKGIDLNQYRGKPTVINTIRLD